jgi:hypothetical protein
MLIRRAATTGVVALGLTAATVLPAAAWEQDFGASADFVGVVAGPGAAALTMTYTCNSNLTPYKHLFVAVKQGGTISPDNAKSGDAHPTSFYSTNWKSDSGPNALTCDGVQHRQTVVLKTDQYWASQPGVTAKPLHAGQALVQICLFSNTVDPNDENSASDIAFDYSMQNVHVGNGVG